MLAPGDGIVSPPCWTRTAVAISALLVFAACSPPPTPASPTHAPAPTSPTVPTGTGSCHEADSLPDHACTPGATNPAVTQANLAVTVCKSGWTATVRPPASYTDALKRQQMPTYGFPAGTALSAVEEDHLVPLEVGGNPTSPLNLWPEPWDGARGAHAKDTIENRAHRDLCEGSITLAQAQSVFLGDFWTAGLP